MQLEGWGMQRASFARQAVSGKVGGTEVHTRVNKCRGKRMARPCNRRGAVSGKQVLHGKR